MSARRREQLAAAEAEKGLLMSQLLANPASSFQMPPPASPPVAMGRYSSSGTTSPQHRSASASLEAEPTHAGSCGTQGAGAHPQRSATHAESRLAAAPPIQPTRSLHTFPEQPGLAFESPGALEGTTGVFDIPLVGKDSAAALATSAGLPSVVETGGLWDPELDMDPSVSSRFPWAVPGIDAGFMTIPNFDTGARYSYELPHVEFGVLPGEAAEQLSLQHTVPPVPCHLGPQHTAG